MHPDPIAEIELDAYVDGELDLVRQLAVEDALARSPDAAARLLARLRDRTALRLAQSPLAAASRPLHTAAERLGERLARTHRPYALWRKPALRAAALIALIGGLTVAFPLARGVQANPPAYVSEAVMSYRTSLLRVAMPSQVESHVFDTGDIDRRTRIRVPTLPADWRIMDVQIFPSDTGPALQLMVRTDDRRTISIFAVRSSEAAPSRPATIRRGDTSVAYWRRGDVAYALTGLEPPAALDVAAEDLANNRLG